MLLLSTIGFSQTSVQWKTTVDVGWDGNTNPRADWLFDVLTTSDGNYLAVGFAREDEAGNETDRPDVPAYCLVGADGKFLRDGVLDNEGRGRLDVVVEGEGDAYFAGGFRNVGGNTTGIIVKINKTDLTAEHFAVVPTGYTKSRIKDVKSFIYTDSNGDLVHHLLISGRAWIGTDESKRWIAIYDYDGNLINEIVFPLANSNLSEDGATIDYDIDDDGKITIYTASYQEKDKGGSSFGGHRRIDSDILLTMVEYDLSGFTVQNTSSHNSITQGARDLFANANLDDGNIFKDYPPIIKDEYPYGPKYKNICSNPAPEINCNDFSRDFENWNEESPVLGYYIEDWSDGSEDRPYSLIVTDDQIVVSALLNQLIMWGAGTNRNLGGDTDGGLHTIPLDCTDYNSDAYYWAEAYVLFFNKNTLELENATHLGTWSGGDFQPKMRQTKDGGFAVSGTITGCPEGLISVGHGEHGIAVKLGAGGAIEYRTSSSAPNDASFCAFAITEALDGGLVLVGNSEEEEEIIVNGVEVEIEKEDYCFVKFGNACGYSDATIRGSIDKPYYTVDKNEEWTSDQTINTQVIIPSGHTLIIKGDAGQPINIQFADSREVYDYDNTSSIGIKVESGGFLIVNNATLTGWSCDGAERMWDGISVKGIENKEQERGTQGFCNLVNASIVNARIGLAASSTGWARRESEDDLSVGEEVNPSTGSLAHREQAPYYWHGSNGGARIYAFSSNFINNRRSALFMKYKHHNKSRFHACDFINDAPLVDQNARQQLDDTDYSSTVNLGTHIHLSAWATNIRVEGCHFSGTDAIISKQRPFGIVGWDASFSVSGGSMETLKVGIEGASSLGSITANHHANAIDFNNVMQGINLRNTTADIIRNCNFDNIPSSDNAEEKTPSGIFGEFNNAALIANNTFTGSNPDEISYGLVLRGTSIQGTEIKENEFTNTRYGNQFEGDNVGLNASCNSYEDIGENAWVCIELKSQGMLGDQGSSFASEKKADNQFFDPCTINVGEKHIFSEFAFNYYDKTGNPNPANVDCVSEVVGFQLVFEDTPLDCETIDPPCNPCDEVGIFQQSGQTIKDRNKALRALIHTEVDIDGEKLPANYEDAMFILQERGLVEDQKLLVGTLTAKGRYSEAEQLLNANAGSGNPETNNLINLITAFSSSLLDPTAGPIHLSHAGNEFLNEDTPTLAMVNNERWLKEGIYTPLLAQNLEKIKEEGKGKRLQSALTTPETVDEHTTKVFPNPFGETLNFDTRHLDDDTVYQLEVINLLGERIWVQNIEGGRKVEWNSSNLPTGTYFYTIRSDSEEHIVSGKIIRL